MLVIGVFWYITADRDFSEDASRNEYLDKHDMKFREGEEGQGLLLDDDEIAEDGIMTSMDDDRMLRDKIPDSARLLSSKADYESGRPSGST